MEDLSRLLWCTSQCDFDNWMESLGDTEPPKGTCVISIIGTPSVLRDYLEEPETKHFFPTGTPRVLNLEFDDITTDRFTRNGITAVGISNEQASEIVHFLEWAISKKLGIIVHCRAGRSRSQAIVRYVKSRWPGKWKTNPLNPDDTPNYYVLGKLRENEDLRIT